MKVRARLSVAAVSVLLEGAGLASAAVGMWMLAPWL